MTSSPPESTGIENVVNIIRNSVKGVRALNRLSSDKKRLFCYDLAFVVLGVRTGYLVDAILPSDPKEVFSNLLRTLRSQSPIFQDIIHILDSTCSQSFLVNGSLLRRRLLHLGDMKFVHLPSSDSCHLGIPAKVRETLETLNARWDATSEPLTLSLPIHDSSVSVPVAAVLIDYPVAFVPNSTITSFLNQIPLDVYECTVKFNLQSHPLLKFSCPTELGMKHPDLSRDRLLAYMRSLLGSKDRLGSWEEADLQVNYRTETRDRVAL